VIIREEVTLQILNIHPHPMQVYGVFLLVFMGISGIITMIFFELLKERNTKKVTKTKGEKLLLAGTISICILFFFIVCVKFLNILAVLFKNEDLQLEEMHDFPLFYIYIAFSISLITLTLFLIGFIPYLLKINSYQFSKKHRLDLIFLIFFVLFLSASFILHIHYRYEEIGEFSVSSYNHPYVDDQFFQVQGSILGTASMFLAGIFIFISIIILNRKLRIISDNNGKLPKFYSHYILFVVIVINQIIFITSIIFHLISYTKFYYAIRSFYFVYTVIQIIQYLSLIALFVELTIKIKQIASMVKFENDFDEENTKQININLNQ